MNAATSTMRNANKIKIHVNMIFFLRDRVFTDASSKDFFVQKRMREGQHRLWMEKKFRNLLELNQAGRNGLKNLGISDSRNNYQNLPVFLRAGGSVKSADR